MPEAARKKVKSPVNFNDQNDFKRNKYIPFQFPHLVQLAW